MNMNMKAKVIIGLVTLAVMFGSYHLFGIPYSVSDGQRSGVVYKISYKGGFSDMFIETWEGQLNLGITGAVDETNTTSTVMKMWEFSVPTDEVAKQIEEAATKGTRVTLHYEQPMVMGVWYGKTEYLVTKVE